MIIKDERLASLAGRPIGGSLPYWMHEVTPNFWLAWHAGFILPCPQMITWPRNPQENRRAMWKFFFMYFQLQPRDICIAVTLACEMPPSIP